MFFPYFRVLGGSPLGGPILPCVEACVFWEWGGQPLNSQDECAIKSEELDELRSQLAEAEASFTNETEEVRKCSADRSLCSANASIIQYPSARTHTHIHK